jgi:hypothetical protein
MNQVACVEARYAQHRDDEKQFLLQTDDDNQSQIIFINKPEE